MTDTTETNNNREARRQLVPAINRAVRNADAAQPETLRSYLAHCNDESQIDPAISALRRNQPEMFNRRTTKKSKR